MAKKAAKKTARKHPAAEPPRGKPEPAVLRKIGKATDIESVRQLVRLMVQNDLTEIRIGDGDVKVHLKRGYAAAAVESASAPAAIRGPAYEAPPAAAAPPEPPVEEFLEIKSPMVGTFYAAASPDSEAYVTVGSNVTEDTVVCIVEAMKVMNEIKAECAGAVAEVCVRDAQPVEYGQTLFKVKPR